MEQLPPATREALERWLIDENIGYHAAAQRLQTDFNVHASPSSLHCFYQRAQQRRMLQRISDARDMARSLESSLSESQPATNLPTIQLIANRAFELAVDQAPNVKDLSALTQLLLKARQQDLEERRIKLLEDRAKLASQAEEVTKSDLTPEEKLTRMRQIFGMQ